MTILPSMLFGLLLATVGLLGIVTLRLAMANRRQVRSIERLAADLDRTREEASEHRNTLAQRNDLDTAKDEFISTVSHELRTPLTSIRGALGLLSAGLLGTVDAKALNLLRIASTNTERLIRLINDILDLERMESGSSTLTLRRCSIYDLAREAVDTMTALADAAQVQLQLTCFAPRDAIYFDADADRILQVLTNLLSNAIKFSPAESKVSVEVDANLDSILLKVVDCGRGIPDDKLEAVFDRFQQVESADASRKGGTGLGLAICRSIVNQHGGAIWAQRNVPAPGTTLWVQFSRAARATDQAPVDVLATPIHRGRGLVLICDDDASIRVVVAEQLRHHGYEILEASNGEEAISLATVHTAHAAHDAQAPTIAAILLDLQMPGLSGWETLRRLKDTPATAAIPVIILSVIPSTAAPPAGQPTRAGEAQGWVQKPFNENLLLAELGRVLRTDSAPGQLLLVEDDLDLAHLILESFRESGIAVDHAPTRRQAVERCLAGPPDLIILDLTLPDGDGYSLVEWLRRQPALRTLPLVVYSGHEITEADMTRLRLGPTQFLSKARVQPIEVERLVLAMVQTLRQPAAERVA